MKGKALAGTLLRGLATVLLPFRGVLERSDTRSIVLPPKSPNLNARVERYMCSTNSECLDRILFFGKESLRRALTEFDAHYHHERHHQGLDNNPIEAGGEVGREWDEVACQSRAGGMLCHCYRHAGQNEQPRTLRIKGGGLPAPLFQWQKHELSCTRTANRDRKPGEQPTFHSLPQKTLNVA